MDSSDPKIHIHVIGEWGEDLSKKCKMEILEKSFYPGVLDVCISTNMCGDYVLNVTMQFRSSNKPYGEKGLFMACKRERKIKIKIKYNKDKRHYEINEEIYMKDMFTELEIKMCQKIKNMMEENGTVRKEIKVLKEKNNAYRNMIENVPLGNTEI